ncbi:MAG: hypothetical protein ACHQNV_06120 [Vicinamibacteria bacterium]
MHVRVCPECGEEFRPEIVHCSDCGTLLQDRLAEEDATAERVAEFAADLPSVGPGTEGKYVRIFRADRAADVEPLAVRLGQAQVPFRVRSALMCFDLLTREEDHDRVHRVLGDLLTSGGHPADADFDPEAGYAACPACGCRLAPQAEECTDCGLAVGGEPDAIGPTDEEQ